MTKIPKVLGVGRILKLPGRLCINVQAASANEAATSSSGYSGMSPDQTRTAASEASHNSSENCKVTKKVPSKFRFRKAKRRIFLVVDLSAGDSSISADLNSFIGTYSARLTLQSWMSHPNLTLIDEGQLNLTSGKSLTSSISSTQVLAAT